MKKIAALLFFTFGMTLAQADIIYTNLNPAKPFDTSNGSVIAAGGSDLSLSFAFTVTGHNYLVTGLTFGAFIGSGANAITATIYSDNGGTPGTGLFTGNEIDNQLVAQGTDNTNDKDLIQQTVNGPLLIAGNVYWLSLDAPPNSQVTWGYNGAGTVGPAAILIVGNWTPLSKEQGAFEIDGNIVAPEPVTSGLLLSGLGTIAFFRRKLKGQ
jgi:hypothetical protein